jgi:hypothetical protein
MLTPPWWRWMLADNVWGGVFHSRALPIDSWLPLGKGDHAPVEYISGFLSTILLSSPLNRDILIAVWHQASLFEKAHLYLYLLSIYLYLQFL